MTNFLFQYARLNQLSLSHKNHFFNADDDNFSLSHEGDEGRGYVSFDPTKTELTKLRSGYTIRVFVVSKSVPHLNSDVLKIIFEFLYDDHCLLIDRKM
jgi:hypothetical protein